MKLLVANGRGASGAGAVSLYGAAVGDRVVAVLAQLPGGGMIEYTDAGWFENVITVADQIQQALPLIHQCTYSVGGTPVFTGVDGAVLTSQHSSTDRRQVAADPGQWRFAFLLEEGRAASGDGAISLKDGVVYVTKGSAAALTLADPTTITDDGKRLTIISTTAFAHTVSNAAGSGFNAGGAAKDVGTFGAVIGNNLIVRAYGGKWLVESSVGVTLA